MSTKLPEIREVFSQTQIAEIQATVAQGLSKTEMTLFLHQCAALNLNPLNRDIYAIKAGSKLQIQISIAGYRKIANRTGLYLGQTPAEWCGKDGQWVDVWLATERPMAARVGVLKKGLAQPVYAVATWKSFGSDSYMWKKMPDHMLAKSAESLALRKAFPEQFSSILSETEHIAEEVDEVSPIDAEFGPEDVPDEQPDRLPEPSGPEAQNIRDDSQLSKADNDGDLGEYVVDFACRYVGKALKDIDPKEAKQYMQVIQGTDKPEHAALLEKMKAYFGT